MTIKLLESYQYLKARVRRLPDEIDNLKGQWAVCGSIMASGPGPAYDMREVIIGERDTSQEARYRIAEKQNELENALCDVKAIESYIASVENARLKEIMTFRFLYGETWDQVARRFAGHESADSCRKIVYRYLNKNS